MVQGVQRTRPWIALWRSGSFSGELVVLPVEIVRSILQSVRPRNQHLTSAGRAHFVCAVSVDKVPAAYGVGAEAAANLDDDRLLISSDNCNLLTRWRDHRSPPFGSSN
jgi:hypothetical protein